MRLIKMNFFITTITLCVLLIITTLFVRPYFKKDTHYTTTAVTRGDIIYNVSAVGMLTPSVQINVGAQVNGQLKSVKVSLGEYVKKGQLLATIDPVLQSNDLHNAEAQLRNIEAQKEAQLSQLKLFKENLSREKMLRQAEANSVYDLDSSISQVDTARANIKAIEAQHAQALIAVQTAKANLNYTYIYSPIDGYVTEIVSKEGQTVVSSQNAPTIMVISDLDNMQVKTKISEADIVRVKTGQTATFKILGLSETTFSTKIKYVEPSPPQQSGIGLLTPSQNDAVYYNAILSVENKKHIFKPMMTALVNITLNKRENVLTVPTSSVIQLKASSPAYVYTLEKNNPVARNVNIGLSNGLISEIITGLNENDIILTNPDEISKGENND